VGKSIAAGDRHLSNPGGLLAALRREYDFRSRSQSRVAVCVFGSRE
jgi:hypothetical protein